MNTLKYSARQLLKNKWQILLVVFFAAIAVALYLLVGQLGKKSENHINKSVSGVDIVVGAKGSPLQLVLSSLFFIDNPTGNISVKEAAVWRKHPLVKESLPLSLGDNYAGNRLVGTEENYPSFLNLHLVEGVNFSKSFEAVVGAKVAAQLGASLGDSFTSQHGDSENGSSHDHPYTVVGILASCGCPFDNVIVVDAASFLESHHMTPEQAEISSLLIRGKTAMAKLQLPRMINENSKLQAAVPAIEADRLNQLSGGAFKLLELFSYLFLAVCLLALLAAFMSRLRELLRDSAILQLSGFSRFFTIKLIFFECFLLSLAGFLTGLLGYFIISKWALAGLLKKYGLDGALALDAMDLTLAFILVLSSAIIAACVPSIKLLSMSLQKVISKEAY